MSRNHLALFGSLCSALFAPHVAGQADAPVVINEFSNDDAGADDAEFVELFNATAAPVDIGGWSVVGGDAGGPDNAANVIPGGTTLAPGAFYVIGMAAVPGVDLAQFGSWQNGTEALTLYDAGGAVVDTVTYETSDSGVFDPALVEGDDGLFGVMVDAGQQPGGAPHMVWGRVLDGLDSGRNGYDFRLQPATPGASNNGGESLRSYFEDFNARQPGDRPAEWVGTHDNAVTIDPGVADANNPYGIHTSGDGGNAGVFWDAAGNSNAMMLQSAVCTSVFFEAYVFFDATPLADPGDHETWTLGFGTTGSYYNEPDPQDVGLPFGTQNGNTGVAWTYQRLGDGSANLYLIDHNDGGWGHNPNTVTPEQILGLVTLAPGLSDGWRHLSLCIVDDQVEAHFGRPGPGHIAMFGTVDVAPRGFYLGYAGDVVGATPARPLTVDYFVVKCCDPATATFYCDAGHHSLGGPVLGLSGLPKLGEEYTLSAGNTHGVITVLAFGDARPAPLPIPFGFSGASFCLDPLATLLAPSGSVTIETPFVPQSCHTVMSVQWFDFDPTSALPLPFGTSRALALEVGL